LNKKDTNLNYKDLIQTVSEIVSNEKIYKDGLVLVYELEEKRHKQMDEHLFYKSNPSETKFTHRELIEVEIGGTLVRFVKKNKK
tara:strand:+ start:874 stop:1125 length:252 start_codon:yes stop_codon:yes gene_type:complete